MKISNHIKPQILLLAFLVLWTTDVSAQSSDFFNSMGKIYTVVAVILVVFIGIVILLINLERRIKKLEKKTEHE